MRVLMCCFFDATNFLLPEGALLVTMQSILITCRLFPL